MWGAVGKPGGLSSLWQGCDCCYHTAALAEPQGGSCLAGWWHRAASPAVPELTVRGTSGPDGLCLLRDAMRGSENIPEAAHLLLIAQQWTRGWINPGGR